MPLTKQGVIDAALEMLRRNNLRDAYIRLVVTRGFGDIGVDPRKCPKASIIIITEPLLQAFGVEAQEKGISAIITWIRRDRVDATSDSDAGPEARSPNISVEYYSLLS